MASLEQLSQLSDSHIAAIAAGAVVVSGLAAMYINARRKGLTIAQSIGIDPVLPLEVELNADNENRVSYKKADVITLVRSIPSEYIFSPFVEDFSQPKPLESGFDKGSVSGRQYRPNPIIVDFYQPTTDEPGFEKSNTGRVGSNIARRVNIDDYDFPHFEVRARIFDLKQEQKLFTGILGDNSGRIPFLYDLRSVEGQEDYQDMAHAICLVTAAARGTSVDFRGQYNPSFKKFQVDGISGCVDGATYSTGNNSVPRK